MITNIIYRYFQATAATTTIIQLKFWDGSRYPRTLWLCAVGYINIRPGDERSGCWGIKVKPKIKTIILRN